MVNASPDTIGTVLDQIVSEVAALATEKSDAVKQALDAAQRDVGTLMDEAEDLPQEAIDAIKRALDPPDWWSLLLIILVEISKLDPHLSIGSMKPEGWSRMVTLTYTTTDAVPRTFTLGLAITDPGLKHGMMFKSSAPIDIGFGDKDALLVKIGAQDRATWTWEFGGPVEAPDASAVVDVEVSWKTVPDLTNDVGGFSVGPLHLAATLAKSPTEPLYKVVLGVGVAGDPGLRAQLHPGKALGVLGQIVHIADLDEQYSPAVSLSAGQAPQFTLGHSGI